MNILPSVSMIEPLTPGAAPIFPRRTGPFPMNFLRSMLDGYELWIVDSCGERLLFVASLQKRRGLPF